MATATEAPASITAEGPTSHTPNQASGRRPGAPSDLQIGHLLRPVNPDRVGKDGKGFAHMEAWDIKRHLIRIFGFGGHDIDLLDVTLISETSQMLRKKNRDGQEYGAPYEAWTVIYRVSVCLTVKVDGIELGHWTGVATGDATNQPSRADAHDLALKTADSQALKRAATNLGDQFGLSLYNKGRLDPVVQASLPYWKVQKETEFKDEKVEAEPEVVAARQEAAEGTPQASAQPATPQPEAGNAPKPSSERLTKLMKQASECWKHPQVLEQIKSDADAHQVLDEQFTAKDGTATTLRTVLDSQIAALKQAADGRNNERNAA
ncbi:Rad52/Rad22 family DNA repair protein [Streptomyces sp. NPDC058700]|uniref:Rad52/Rad22 family DNA repair protein n=1 Tax=Streptomyces sp. NPDC058700 TaxID=3346607 RepID=UPI003656AB44